MYDMIAHHCTYTLPPSNMQSHDRYQCRDDDHEDDQRSLSWMASVVIKYSLINIYHRHCISGCDWCHRECIISMQRAHETATQHYCILCVVSAASSSLSPSPSIIINSRVGGTLSMCQFNAITTRQCRPLDDDNLLESTTATACLCSPRLIGHDYIFVTCY